MDLFRIESSAWRLFDATAVPAFMIFLSRLRRRFWPERSNLCSSRAVSRRGPKWVAREIARLCAGDEPDELLSKQMAPEDRALFEVSIIDVLNRGTRKDQHRLRSALIKYGYDEQCSRRVMSPDFSDRVRATALLNLLRPQWRDTSANPEQHPGQAGKLKARVAGSATGPHDDASRKS